ncbi:MAG: hypothetical protein RXR20_15590 [Paraburkholderia sp.]|jgi:hypothetical protein|uniref:hypothetical protein n=1 Tax=Burkholderiaceae TaxID=119060 RepID=UPI0010F5AE04|nr:hypothetical protein [Burkholderia sp. 4M9327F10]
MIRDPSGDNASSLRQYEAMDAWRVTTRSKRGTFPQLQKNTFFCLGLLPLTGHMTRLRQQARAVLAGAANAGRIEPNANGTTSFRRLI